MLLLQAPRSITSWPKKKNRHLPSVWPSLWSVSQHRWGSVNPPFQGRLSPLFHLRGLVEWPPCHILNLCSFPSLGQSRQICPLLDPGLLLPQETPHKEISGGLPHKFSQCTQPRLHPSGGASAQIEAPTANDNPSASHLVQGGPLTKAEEQQVCSSGFQSKRGISRMRPGTEGSP